MEIIKKIIEWLLSLLQTIKSVEVKSSKTDIKNTSRYFKVIYSDGWMPVEEPWYEESRKIIDNKIFVKMAKISDDVKEIRWFYHDHNGKLNIVLKENLLDEFKDE